MSNAKTTDARLRTAGEYDRKEVAGAEECLRGREATGYRRQPTGLLVPMDVMAEIHLRRFVGAFANVTLQSLEAHAETYFDWVNEVPHLQCKMAEWAAAASGQLPA